MRDVISYKDKLRNEAKQGRNLEIPFYLWKRQIKALSKEGFVITETKQIPEHYAKFFCKISFNDPEPGTFSEELYNLSSKT